MGGDEPIVKLGDVTDLLTGYPFKSLDFTEEKDDVRLLRGDNIVQGDLRWDGVKRWPRQMSAAYEEYLLRPGDVVLAMDRPWIEAGLKYAALSTEDCPSLLVQRVSRLRAKSGLDQRFLRYVIGSAQFTNYILGTQTGTAVPHISSTQIKAYEFQLPPLCHQAQSADLLSSLTDKIALNRRMAGTLERISLALFQSWFVDFDPVRRVIAGQDPGLPTPLAALFPATFADDGLPERWSMERVGDVYDIVGGNTPSTEQTRFWGGTHAWATPRDLSKLNAPILLTPERTLTDEGLRTCSSGLLPTGTLFLSSRAPVGYLAFVNQPTAINQGIAAFRRKSVSTSFAWAWCHANMALIVASANGSTFLEISKGVLRQLPMVQAPETIMRAFAEIVDPLVDRIIALVQQNATLAALRDALLPRLISGELRVSDARKITASI